MNRCGNCTACCYFDYVPEIEKPVKTFCEHIIPGVGCKIYQKRPNSCAEYRCLWYACNLPLELRPDKCRVHFERYRKFYACTISTFDKEEQYLYTELPLLLMLMLLECNVSLLFTTKDKQEHIRPNTLGFQYITEKLEKIYGGPIPQNKRNLLQKYKIDIESYFASCINLNSMKDVRF